MWKQRGFFDQRNYVEKKNMEKTWIFQPEKLHRRKYVEKNKKSTWKQCGFFDHRNYVEKSTWKQRGFFDQRNDIEKVRRNEAEIRRNLFFDVST